MANPEHVQKIKEGRPAWKKWRNEHPNTHPDLSGERLDMQDFSHFPLDRSDFTGTVLDQSNLTDASLIGATLEGASLVAVNLVGAKLIEADLVKADLSGANLTKASLRLADLRGANLTSATLTHAEFAQMAIDRTTTLHNLRFGKDHAEMNDGTALLRWSKFDQIVNWTNLRILSDLPLFGVSYAGLALLFALAHGIDIANTHGLRPLRLGLDRLSESLAAVQPQLDAIRGRYPSADEYFHGQLDALAETLRGFESIALGLSSELPPQLSLPDETPWAFLSIIFVAFGATLYRFACPPSVQSFTEIEWVAQLQRPRLMYISDSMACGRRGWRTWRQTASQLLVGASVTVGGAIAMVILAMRLWKLWQVIWLYT